MKVVAEELTEDEVVKILVKLGVAENKTGNSELSTGERDEDWYFWFVNNNTQVVMEKCRANEETPGALSTSWTTTNSSSSGTSTPSMVPTSNSSLLV